MSNKLIDIIDITKSYDENVSHSLVLVDVEKQHYYVFSVDLRHRTPVILFLMEKISTVFRQTVVS